MEGKQLWVASRNGEREQRLQQAGGGGDGAKSESGLGSELELQQLPAAPLCT